VGLIHRHGVDGRLRDRYILDDLSFAVNPGDRTGVVGRNGSGKTTLFPRPGQRAPARVGRGRARKNVRCGYLPQDIQEAVSGTLLRSVIDSVPGRVEHDRRAAQAEGGRFRDVHTEEEQLKALRRLARLHERQLELDTHYPEHEAAVILAGLGFIKTPELDRPLANPERRLEACARCWRACCTSSPDVLLLVRADQPTSTCPRYTGWRGSSATTRAPSCWSATTGSSRQQISRVIAFERSRA